MTYTALAAVLDTISCENRGQSFETGRGGVNMRDLVQNLLGDVGCSDVDRGDLMRNPLTAKLDEIGGGDLLQQPIELHLVVDNLVFSMGGILLESLLPHARVTSGDERSDSKLGFSNRNHSRSSCHHGQVMQLGGAGFLATDRLDIGAVRSNMLTLREEELPWNADVL